MVSKQIGDVITHLHTHTNINTWKHIHAHSLTHPLTYTQTDKWTHGAHISSSKKTDFDQKSKLFIHFIRHFHLLTSYATQHYVYSPLWNWAFLTQIDLKKLFIRNTAQIHQESIQFCNALKNTLFWPILVGNPSISSFSQ